MAYIYDLADTWAESTTVFTGIKLNVTDIASSANSLLMNLSIGGNTRLSLRKTGVLIMSGGGATDVVVFTPTGYNLNIQPYSGTGFDFNNFAGFRTPGGLAFGPNFTNVVRLERDGDNVLAQRNGINPQTFNIYNTYTNDTNYERFFMKWDGNVFKIGNDAAGTGSIYRLVEFYRAGVKMITLTAQYVYIDGGALELTNAFTPWLIIPQDSSPPTSGYTNKAIIFAENDGTGKTRLMAKFPTGASVQIAIEP